MVILRVDLRIDLRDERDMRTIHSLEIGHCSKRFSGDLVHRGSRITLSRFPHGGKRHCQRPMLIPVILSLHWMAGKDKTLGIRLR